MSSARFAVRGRVARALSRAAGVVLAGAIASCNKSYPNPFENSNQMVPPPAGATIVVAANTYSTKTGGGRDLFAMDDNGGGLTRLTLCNNADRQCDYIEPIPGPSRERVAVRRLMDTNGDGKLTAADGESLRVLDLSRQVEGELVAGNARVSGADWSPGEEVLFYSAAGSATGTGDDIYQITSNAQQNANLTSTPNARERRPRFNSGGTNLAFEHIEADGKGQLWVATSLGLRTLTTGADVTGDVLAGTPYVVGSDADPVFSPDGRVVLFRRLTATGNGGAGFWDLMTMRLDTTGAVPTPFISGPAFRGAPDWNATGIVFVEMAPGAGPQVVFVDATGGGRKVLMTGGAGFNISYPHWLK
jgi:Tol biopolymer transport system component